VFTCANLPDLVPTRRNKTASAQGSASQKAWTKTNRLLFLNTVCEGSLNGVLEVKPCTELLNSPAFAFV
jgi:hypothetical protein